MNSDLTLLIEVMAFCKGLLRRMTYQDVPGFCQYSYHASVCLLLEHLVLSYISSLLMPHLHDGTCTFGFLLRSQKQGSDYL